MAKFDFGLVGGLPKKEEPKKEELPIEEIRKHLKVLEERYDEILSLPKEEFLSKEIQEELVPLRKKMLEYAIILLNSFDN